MKTTGQIRRGNEMKTWMIWGIVAGMLLGMAGCEDDNGGRKVERIVEETTESGGEGNASHYSTRDVGGTWKGKAGTGQGKTVLTLRQNGDSLSGSWVWGAKDTRYCSGHRDGSSIYLRDNRADGDSWKMTLSEAGSHMGGRGEKYGGGSYALSFSR